MRYMTYQDCINAYQEKYGVDEFDAMTMYWQDTYPYISVSDLALQLVSASQIERDKFVQCWEETTKYLEEHNSNRYDTYLLTSKGNDSGYTYQVYTNPKWHTTDKLPHHIVFTGEIGDIYNQVMNECKWIKGGLTINTKDLVIKYERSKL